MPFLAGLREITDKGQVQKKEPIVINFRIV